jgi:hypothetical protein
MQKIMQNFATQSACLSEQDPCLLICRSITMSAVQAKARESGRTKTTSNETIAAESDLPASLIE